MRKIVPVLFALGAFLLIAGIVAAVYGPSAAKKTPLDVDTVTHLSGVAAKLDTSTSKLVTTPVKAVSITKTDSKHSDGSVVTFATTSCLVIDEDNPSQCLDGSDPRLITASTDVFATDRSSALAVKSSFLPSSAEPHSGLQNKWPFDAEKKTYPYWDSTTSSAVPAKYVGTTRIDGLEVYAYRSTIKDADIAIGEGISGTYDDVKTSYVEPATGAIVNQTDDQQRYLSDGSKVLDLRLAFTGAQQKQNVADAKDNTTKLKTLTTYIPIVGVVLGLLVLITGAALLRRGRGRRPARDAGAGRDAGSGAGGVTLAKS